MSNRLEYPPQNSEKDEPFFVKNLETVQGDERDTIIFSVAYAKDSLEYPPQNLSHAKSHIPPFQTQNRIPQIGLKRLNAPMLFRHSLHNLGIHVANFYDNELITFPSLRNTECNYTQTPIRIILKMLKYKVDNSFRLCHICFAFSVTIKLWTY